MTVQYLLDENVNRGLRGQLEHAVPGLVVRVVADPNAPPRGTPDPGLLRWCEEHGFCLVTRDHRTMPQHLRDHLAAGGHVPGIFVWRKGVSIGRVLEHLVLIALASDEHEFRDQIVFLPFQSDPMR